MWLYPFCSGVLEGFGVPRGVSFLLSFVSFFAEWNEPPELPLWALSLPS